MEIAATFERRQAGGLLPSVEIMRRAAWAAYLARRIARAQARARIMLNNGRFCHE